MKVFYHNDLDGLASAAIVRYRFKLTNPEDFIEINYGMPFPWHKISPTETVYIVDFCLQPFSDMLKLYSQIDDGLIWIDHHKTALEEWEKAGKPGILGLRRDGTAACVLTWKYFFGKSKKIPKTIELLGRYDIWDLDDEVVEFQMGMRLKNYNPFNIFWNIVFDDYGYGNEELLIDEIREEGKTVIKWEEQRAREYCKSYAIETFLHGHRAIACNTGFVGSKFFESTFSFDDYSIFISFCMLPSSKWTVSLYSRDIDVGKIAKSFGGGGHKGAAGFQLDYLPFDI